MSKLNSMKVEHYNVCIALSPVPTSDPLLQCHRKIGPQNEKRLVLRRDKIEVVDLYQHSNRDK